MTLTEFLLARITEDEAVVAAWPESLPSLALGGDLWRDTMEHAIYPGRARVLAECEAKRRLVERYASLAKHGDSGDARWVLPLLALPYADHPDYQAEWMP